jgi:hypothetical protein
MPAWRAESSTSSRRQPLLGSAPALQTIRELIGPQPNDTFAAVQAAVASFARYGFAAAAITALAVVGSERVRASPAVRRLARVRGLGRRTSGSRGRLTALRIATSADVAQSVERRLPKPRGRGRRLATIGSNRP